MTEGFVFGDEKIALENEILRSVVGSELVGLSLGEASDRDEMGIYIETPEQLLGIQPSSEHYISRTKPTGERSGPGDLDLTLYSLRKWMRLACDGNPTVLQILFSPYEFVLNETNEGYNLRHLVTEYILSQKVGARHLGYLDGQRERMIGGGSRRRVPNRPELVEQFGYDTKYASHALRLGYQGYELLTTGALSLPMKEPFLRTCLMVKRGEVDFTTALEMVDEAREYLHEAIHLPSQLLPPEPSMECVNRWMVRLTNAHWGIFTDD